MSVVWNPSWGSGFTVSGSSTTKYLRAGVDYTISETNRQVTISARSGIQTKGTGFSANVTFETKINGVKVSGGSSKIVHNSVTTAYGSRGSMTFDKSVSEYTVPITAKGTTGEGRTRSYTINVTIPAAVTHEVTYDATSGVNPPESQIIIEGEPFNISSVIPINEHHAFIGWSFNSDGSGTLYQQGESLNITEDVILYAVWLPQYEVVYDLGGGIGNIQNDYVIQGQYINITDVIPSKDMYDFLGWKLLIDGQLADYTSGDSFTTNEDVILYAHWHISYKEPKIENLRAYRVEENPDSSQYSTGLNPEVKSNGTRVYFDCDYTPPPETTVSDIQCEILFDFDGSIITGDDVVISGGKIYGYSAQQTDPNNSYFHIPPTASENITITLLIHDYLYGSDGNDFKHIHTHTATTFLSSENYIFDAYRDNGYTRIAPFTYEGETTIQGVVPFEPDKYYYKSDSGLFHILHEEPSDWYAKQCNYYTYSIDKYQSFAIGGPARDHNSDLILSPNGDFDVEMDAHFNKSVSIGDITSEESEDSFDIHVDTTFYKDIYVKDSASSEAQKLLDIIYPIGSTYVAPNPDIHPAELFGGSWQLYDKKLRNIQLNETNESANRYIFAKNKCSTYNIWIVVSDSCYTVEFIFSNSVTLNDTAVEIGTFNIEALGFSHFGASNICAWTDGGNAVIYLEISDAGVVKVHDIRSSSSSVSSGNTIKCQFSVTRNINSILDSACDRFYWRRVEPIV